MLLNVPLAEEERVLAGGAPLSQRERRKLRRPMWVNSAMDEAIKDNFPCRTFITHK